MVAACNAFSIRHLRTISLHVAGKFFDPLQGIESYEQGDSRERQGGAPSSVYTTQHTRRFWCQDGEGGCYSPFPQASLATTGPLGSAADGAAETATGHAGDEHDLSASQSRLAKDFKNPAQTLATFVILASIQLALKRLARA